MSSSSSRSLSSSRRARVARRAVSPVAVTAALALAVLAGAPYATAVAEPPARGADAGAGAGGEGVPALKVLSYNVFLFSKLLYPNWGQDHRAGAIPAADFFRGQDVVVLQEAFDNSSSEALQRAAAGAYPHQTPVVGRSEDGWDATGGEYSALAPEDGGVTILSKWPILRQEQFVYEDGCGTDALSNKGFAYVALDVAGARVHVVGTHTQATDSLCAEGEAVSVRAAQFRQIDAFLDAKGIPAGEQVLVAGDLNVDLRGPEYASMLAGAGLVAADVRDGHRYSFDTEGNSVAADRYPDSPSEDLDYVLHRAGHDRPAGWTNTVVPARSAPWTVSSWGEESTYTHLSDHHPVVASGRAGGFR